MTVHRYKTCVLVNADIYLHLLVSLNALKLYILNSNVMNAM